MRKAFWTSKVAQDLGALTVLTSKTLSRRSVVQILQSWTSKSRPNLCFERFWLRNRSRATAWCKFLRAWTSKSGPTMPVFSDFDFRIALSPQRGANCGDIFGSRPSAPARFISWLSEPSTPQNYGKTQHFVQFLPAKPSSSQTSQLYHIRAITSLGWQIFSGNSQYSRKLDF